MLEQIHFLFDALGSYQAVADYLGYTTRQLYNIRKRLEQGRNLHRRVETHLSRMIDQLGR
ncbi:hypothetical protein LJB99_05770 [Deltaproteobacteria bacterium OttesenSCG-928-K17]|nr:hypothetical protein [Deltaproteobacteria bacterium OttesenSCG-928-K17]